MGLSLEMYHVLWCFASLIFSLPIIFFSPSYIPFLSFSLLHSLSLFVSLSLFLFLYPLMFSIISTLTFSTPYLSSPLLSSPSHAQLCSCGMISLCPHQDLTVVSVRLLE